MALKQLFDAGKIIRKIRWAELSLSPLGFGEFEEVTYVAVDPVGPGARPIVAMDIDSDGFIYIVSAYDSGSDDEHYGGIMRLLTEKPAY